MGESVSVRREHCNSNILEHASTLSYSESLHCIRMVANLGITMVKPKNERLWGSSANHCYHVIKSTVGDNLVQGNFISPSSRGARATHLISLLASSRGIWRSFPSADQLGYRDTPWRIDADCLIVNWGFLPNSTTTLRSKDIRPIKCAQLWWQRGHFGVVWTSSREVFESVLSVMYHGRTMYRWNCAFWWDCAFWGILT